MIMAIRLTLLLAAMLMAAQAGAHTSHSPSFTPDSVTVSGHIGNSTDIVSLTLYLTDNATGQDLPRVITVNPDGTFSRTLLLPHSQTATLSFTPRDYTRIYLDPGSDLTLEIPAPDQPKSIRYGGSLGTINAELAAAPEWQSIMAWSVTEQTSPTEFKDSVLTFFAGLSETTENYIATLPPDSRAPALLRNRLLADKGTTLLDYADINESHPLLPASFYSDFVGEMLRADSTILFTHLSSLMLNRLAFSMMLPSRSVTANMADVNRAIDFLREHGGEPSGQKWESAIKQVNLSSPDTLQAMSINSWLWLVSELHSTADGLGVRDEFMTTFGSRLNTNVFLSEADSHSVDIAFIKSLAGTEQVPLLWQYATCNRSAGSIIENDYAFLPEPYGITDSTIVSRLRKEWLAAHSTEPQALPDNDGGRLMAQLAAPFRGKYLLVDFWDIFCGPCRYGIETNKENRDKYRDNPNVGFLFICSEAGSPIDLYHNYVAEHLKDEQCVRLPEHQIGLLRELFNFNAIPRYVFIGPDGRVINSNYSPYEFFSLMAEKALL